MTQRQAFISWVASDIPGAASLGAHVNHDERSKNFPAQVPTRAEGLKKKTHRNYGPPLDQNGIGACVGFTAANYLNTKPHKPLGRKLKSNDDGFLFYSEGTKRDPWQGEWAPPPPGSGQDTGTDALSVCKYLKEIGLIGAYRWNFGLEMTLQSLQKSPVMVGIEWYDGFDRPDKNGLVKLTGTMRGRHEVLLIGLNPKTRMVLALQAWGRWGMRGEGYFKFSWDDLGYLLNRQGDSVVPEPV